MSDILWMGYTRVTLKSDNEPAIVKLLREALRELRIQGLEQCLEEHSLGVLWATNCTMALPMRPPP